MCVFPNSFEKKVNKILLEEERFSEGARLNLLLFRKFYLTCTQNMQNLPPFSPSPLYMYYIIESPCIFQFLLHSQNNSLPPIQTLPLSSLPTPPPPSYHLLPLSFLFSPSPQIFAIPKGELGSRSASVPKPLPETSFSPANYFCINEIRTFRSLYFNVVIQCKAIS